MKLLMKVWGTVYAMHSKNLLSQDRFRATLLTCSRLYAVGVRFRAMGPKHGACAMVQSPTLPVLPVARRGGLAGNIYRGILAEGAIALPVTLSGGALFAS